MLTEKCGVYGAEWSETIYGSIFFCHCEEQRDVACYERSRITIHILVNDEVLITLLTNKINPCHPRYQR